MTKIQAEALNEALEPFINNATAIGFISTGDDHRPIQATSNDVVTDAINVVVDRVSNKTLADVGDYIRYTISFINNSSVDVYGVKIFNNISPKTTLVPDSIIPPPQPGETLETGITVTSPGENLAGRVPRGKSAFLEYEVFVNEGATGEIINTGNAFINFLDCENNEYSGCTDPSEVITTVIDAGLQIIQSADKTFVSENNEEVVYTLIIKNTGIVKIFNITVTNPIPTGMVYKTNSTLKNDVPSSPDINPADGINIGDLGPGETYKLQYSLAVSL